MKRIFYIAVLTFLSFAAQLASPTMTYAQVNITEAKGWFESAYVKFNRYNGAKTYNVYVKGGQYNSYTKIDNQLVRNYGSYGRADVVGLKASTNYALKVVPVDNNGNEITAAATEKTGLTVKSYSRAGFAHFNCSGVGAYNNDGTLKSGVQVIYLTANNAKTVSATLSSGTFTGIQAILAAYESGNVTTPLDVRIIGCINAGDVDSFGSSAEGLQIKGKSGYSTLNITIEGIGDDATIKGFGFLIRNSKSVEFRNFAIIRCMDDGISLDTKNSNIWIHNLDLFYGKEGSGDHVKGDGSIDLKGDSKYISVSYCRYWDTGKSNLFGMKSETGPNYISYDHNWFDHSDSRHPRVRTMSVHVWNNYFDNCAKYGVGVTYGASVFVENNYFLKTKKPMMSSKQGTDGLGEGTFSGEDGGMIKAYGNYFDTSISNFSYYTQNNQASTGYDAYETTTRNAQVPSTQVTKAGGTSYNNFDTNSSLMYSYTPDAASNVPSVVTGFYGAGRLNHGDITHAFSNNTGNESTDSQVDAMLASKIDNYSSAFVGYFGDANDNGGGENGGENGGNENGGENGGGNTTGETITCWFDKSGTPSSSFFTVSGNGSNSKGEITVDGVTYNTCLKIETLTTITFTTTVKMRMTLYFGSEETASIKINGSAITGSGNTYTQTIEAGAYTLTKDKSVNLFYIKLEPIENGSTNDSFSISTSAQHGTITPSVSIASAGTTVTLSVTPDTDYELESIAVTTVTGEIVSLSGNSFVMPAADVTVTATFSSTSSPSQTYDLTVSSAGVATLYLPYDASVPDVDFFVVASVKEVSGTTAYLKEIRGGVIPAYTGVMVFANPGTYSLSESSVSASESVESLLHGVVENTSVQTLVQREGKSIYVLSRGVQEYVGFKVAGGTVKTIGAYKAYLPVENSGEALAKSISISFGGDDALDIELLKSDMHDQTGDILDLTGRKVTAPEKGIYIVNGKKVLYK